MPNFSLASKTKLLTCHPELQRLFNEVIKHWDCQILEGHRGKEAQNKAFREGNSKLQWPKGKHNKLPSLAIDVAPYPIDWKDTQRFIYFAGFVKGIAATLGIKLRYGGDWDSDTQMTDENFRDLVHFEYIEN